MRDLKAIPVRTYVKVRGEDAYRERTPAELAAAVRKAAEKNKKQKKQQSSG